MLDLNSVSHSKEVNWDIIQEIIDAEWTKKFGYVANIDLYYFAHQLLIKRDVSISNIIQKYFVKEKENTMVDLGKVFKYAKPDKAVDMNACFMLLSHTDICLYLDLVNRELLSISLREQRGSSALSKDSLKKLDFADELIDQLIVHQALGNTNKQHEGELIVPYVTQWINERVHISYEQLDKKRVKTINQLLSKLPKKYAKSMKRKKMDKF